MENKQPQHPPLNSFLLALIAVLVGVIGGFGAVAFRALIAFFHNLLFLGKFSLVYEANIHTTPSPWGPFVILVPVLGAAGVSFLVTHFAPEAKGHGVPEVMDAIYYNRGIIRPVVAVVKSLASGLSIGSGGSVGREGPIVQIGSAFGSTLGQYIPMATWQRITLIAAGTGAGIAATFNTPIGGLLFAMEIMLHEVSVRTMVPVAISTATATYIGRVFFGVYPAFSIPELQTPFFHLLDPLLIVSYFGVGIITGIGSAIYIHSIYFFEDIFDKAPGNYYLRHMAGMFLVGILMYLCMTFLGHYYIEGVGYAGIEDVLIGKLSEFKLLVLLFVLKLLVTSLTLGSGASGGIFSPALFLGAMAGAAYGVALKSIFPFLPISPPVFALAGMAGMVCGSTGAAITALVMVFEMTLDYSAVLPLTVTVATSNGIRAFLSRETIYTLKLVRRGHFMPNALRTNFQYLHSAKSIMESSPAILPGSMPIEDFARLVSEGDSLSFLVEDQKSILGMVSGKDALKALNAPSGMTLGDLAEKKYITISEKTPLFAIVRSMRAEGANAAIVVRKGKPLTGGNVLGVITRERIADLIEQSVASYEE
ncbi:MAG: chloride channel protein [Syntrophobacteraceae bacterium]|jgi:CIC family chloride channel protein